MIGRHVGGEFRIGSRGIGVLALARQSPGVGLLVDRRFDGFDQAASRDER